MRAPSKVMEAKHEIAQAAGALAATFGAGAGSYAEVTRGCEGDVLSAESFPLRDVGLGVEHERGNVVFVRANVHATDALGASYRIRHD